MMKMKKIATPDVDTLTFSALVKKFKFEAQVKTKSVKGQRNHLARHAAGKTKHLDKVALSQSIIQAVKRVVRGKTMGVELIDGNHRILKWLAEGYCPFEKLILVTHTLECESEEALNKEQSKLMRTIDSKRSVKTAADYYSAAVVDAGLNPVSNAYKVGQRASSFFKRTVGSTSKMTDPELMASYQENLVAHKFMDRIFALVEDRSVVGAKQADLLFTAGTMIAFFNLVKGASRIPQPVQKTFEEAIYLACKHPSVPRKVCSEGSRLIADILTDVCSLDNHTRIRATASKNREGCYDVLAAQLCDALGQHLPVIAAGVRMPRIKAI